MTEIRNLLDIATEYAAQKDTTSTYPDQFTEQEAEAKLNEIALRFKKALNNLLVVD